MLRFIDDGQRAHYLIGQGGSGPARPSGARVKLGVVAPHSAVRPHLHGVVRYPGTVAAEQVDTVTYR